MICQYEKCDNEVKDTGVKYCSLACSNRDRIYTKVQVEKQCLECLNTFFVNSTNKEKVFCTRSCAAKYNNRRRRSESYQCKNCGEPLRGETRYTRVYCSIECRRQYRINLWLRGEWDGTTREGLAQSIRTYLLEEAGFKCQDGRSGCDGWSGYNPKSGKSCLTVDHIDGDCYNNKRENLIVMCPNCHSMTETYGALNKGNGRMLRRRNAPLS